MNTRRFSKPAEADRSHSRFVWACLIVGGAIGLALASDACSGDSVIARQSASTSVGGSEASGGGAALLNVAGGDSRAVGGGGSPTHLIDALPAGFTAADAGGYELGAALQGDAGAAGASSDD